MSGLHLIYTNYPGYGWSLRSPQLPGLVAGRDDLPTLLQDTPALLAQMGIADFTFDDPGLHVHEEHVLEAPDGTEYLVRWQTNGDPRLEEERAAAASRLESSVHLGPDEELKDRQPALPTGERLLIGVAGSDTIAMFSDQLNGKPGWCAAFSKHEGNDLLLTVPFGEGVSVDGAKWDIEALGLTRDSTFDDMALKIVTEEAWTMDAPAPDPGFRHELTSL